MNREIADARREAEEAGDSYVVDLCDRAIAMDAELFREEKAAGVAPPIDIGDAVVVDSSWRGEVLSVRGDIAIVRERGTRRRDEVQVERCVREVDA